MLRVWSMSIVEELETAGEALSPLVRAVLLRQEQRIAELERAVAELRARLGMNSSNSSRPPSSDPPGTRLGRELLKLWPALWTWSRIEGVEPTNNAAEAASADECGTKRR
jgi:hypothetical protein